MHKLNSFILLLLCCFSVKGQSNHTFTAYSVNEGLPQSSVWDITQDKNNFLWVSTSDGICRFDGFKFTVYKNDLNNPRSILYGNENFFFTDKQNRLWIASSKGFSIYNDTHDDFDNIFINRNNTSNLYYPKNCIYGEHEGYMWAAAPRNGFIKINLTNNSYESINTPGGKDVSNNTYWSQGFIENGCIYGTTDIGFFKYNIAANKIDTFAQKGSSATIYNLNKDEVLTCTSFFLYFINKKTLKVRSVPLHLPKSVELVTDLERNWEDSSQVVLATPVGLQFVDIASGKLVRSLTDFDPGKENKYSYAECFYHDKSGNFWIGLNGDGLRKISYPFKKFNHFKTNNAKSSVVKSLYVNKEKVYTGYFNNGIDVFSRNNKFEKNIDVSKIAGTSNNNIYGIFPINKNDFFLYVFGEERIEFLRYSALLNSFTNITAPFQKKLPQYPFLKNSLFCFSQKEDGSILAGCHNYILSIKFSSTIPEVNIVDSLPNQEINCLFRESDNNLWVGTYIGLFNIKNGIKKYINLGKAFLIKSINQDNDGNTWVGGTEGLYVIGKDGKLKQGYTENTGLLNHHIYGVLKDDDGNMWYSSNKGLGVFYSKEKKFRFFTKEDGLQANEFNGKAFLKATDGELFFGGINGTNSFYTNEIKNNPYTFPVIITSIKLFDEPYKTDSAYWKVKSLILPYTDNNLSFEFVMPEFTKAPLNQYTFMMEGVDKNWINNGEKRFARYPNLNPGTYTFKVKACNDDGIWGSTITTINIEIVAPFWQHLWFLLLTGIFIVALVVGTVVLIQKQQFKKKMRTIEVQYKIQLERERISRDLHDNVGTQLSLISKSIHGMMQDSANISEEDKKKKLQSTGQSSMEVISALRETIWALNKEEVSIQEFFDKLKSFAQKQSDLNPTTKLEFKEASGNNELLLGPAEALHLFRICQEAITNALKYANATLLKIEMKTTGHKYIISIADNGIGFNKNNINTTMHYGLENMKHRAKEITCNINIAAQANEGTTITITKE